MERKTVSALVLTLLLTGTLTLIFTPDIQIVEAEPTTWTVDDDGPANFPKIQQAITAANPGDIIYVKAGVYFEHIVANKKVSIIGENRATTIIDANKTHSTISVLAHDVVIKEFTIKGGNETGVYLYNSDNTMVTQNNIIENEYAVWVRYSDKTTVDANVISNNTKRGILITLSWDFTVSNNEVYGNGWYGIHYNASFNGLIKKNKVYENDFAGIGIHDGSRNISVVGNTVTNNNALGARGIWVENSFDNLIYHNTFINNSVQSALSNSTSKWDNGIEGNYWSDYAGVDNNQDGISDTPHILAESNRDNHPLMGTYSEFITFLGFPVGVISNSSIECFEFYSSNNTIKMYVSNVSTTQSFGFSRMDISKGVITPPYTITIDDGLTDIIYFNDTILESRTQRTIYFSYPLSIHKVMIQGGPPSDITSPTISIISPENKTYAMNFVPLTFTIDEPASYIGYSLNGQTNVMVVGNTTIIGLSEGEHMVIVYANDTNGNMGHSNTVRFTVDTTPPNIHIVSPENKIYETDSVSLNLTVNEPVIWIGYSLDGRTNVTISGNTTLLDLTNGLHSLVVYATDAVGHTDSSETISFTVKRQTGPSDMRLEPFLVGIALAIVTAVGAGIALIYYLIRIRKSRKVKPPQ